MQTIEKVGLGLAGVAIGGLMLVMVVTKPDPGPSAPVSSSSSASGPRIATISSGERVELKAHLQPGVRTVIEFTAKW